MKKKGILNFIAVYLLAAVLALQTAGISTTLSASSTTGVEISDLLSEPQTTQSTTVPNTDNTSTKNNDLIEDIANGVDYSKVDSEIVDKASGVINYYVGIAVQIIAYIITAALTLSKLLDIAYIVIPISRTYLANGYMGNAAAAGTPGGQMNGGMPGMGMGPGMMGGGMPGMGMGGMGMAGRGRYGMGGGMMGMGGMGMSGMDGQTAMQNQPARGRVQFVSNAALNAVATESVVGTDGKGQSAFKVYFSDMIVSSIATGILIVLCITGVMSKLGFLLGDLIVNVIGNIKF